MYGNSDPGKFLRNFPLRSTGLAEAACEAKSILMVSLNQIPLYFKHVYDCQIERCECRLTLPQLAS